jgi:hypothetical protein
LIILSTISSLFFALKGRKKVEKKKSKKQS